MIEYAHIYRLLHIKGLGNKGLYTLLKAANEQELPVEHIFTLSKEELHKRFPFLNKGRYSRISMEDFYETESFLEEYELLQQAQIAMLTVFDENYPFLLKSRLTEAAPVVLFYKGNPRLLSTKSISVVGSRGVSERDIALTVDVAKVLAGGGYNVVSGYAKGVDTAAHRGALEGDGTTTVVLSMGLKQFSVKRDFQNYDWERNSLFLSQFLPRQPWNARFAMQRNKTVCAISDAVVVIASGPEKDARGRMSGTFDAAKFALKKQIPLFVLDPDLLGIEAEGNRQLLERGAMLFRTANDILTLLKAQPASEVVKKGKQLSLFPTKESAS